MRYSEIVIDEEVNKREWVFYHGTKSAAFDKFNPHAADKGEQYWNPLGNGMYATNNPRFAAQFGPNVFRVVIPQGCRYKRINDASWKNTGFSLVLRALKAAFKRCGENYDHWDNGSPLVSTANKKMSRDDVLNALITCLQKSRSDWSPQMEQTVRQNATRFDDAALLAELKNKVKFGPKDRDYEKGRKISQFRIQLFQLLARMSPYEGLYESAALIQIIFGEQIGEAYEDVLPKISDAVFGKYDFVVFTSTNDVYQYADEKESMEIVIFNPELQRTVPDQRREQAQLTAMDSAARHSS
jgi:hypothetical protein